MRNMHIWFPGANSIVLFFVSPFIAVGNGWAARSDLQFLQSTDPSWGSYEDRLSD